VTFGIFVIVIAIVMVMYELVKVNKYLPVKKKKSAPGAVGNVT
jgi:hypothetical protein